MKIDFNPIRHNKKYSINDSIKEDYDVHEVLETKIIEYCCSEFENFLAENKLSFLITPNDFKASHKLFIADRNNDFDGWITCSMGERGLIIDFFDIKIDVDIDDYISEKFPNINLLRNIISSLDIYNSSHPNYYCEDYELTNVDEEANSIAKSIVEAVEEEQNKSHNTQ